MIEGENNIGMVGRPTGVVLEMGSQSEVGLERMFADAGLEMTTLPADTPAEQLESFDVVVGSGGANSVHDNDAPAIDPRILRPGFGPLVIGVCLTSQMMVHLNGGTVTPSDEAVNGTYGQLEVDVIDERADGGLAKLVKPKFVHSNGDHFTRNGLPPHFVPTAMTGDHVAAFVDTQTGNVGFQFHPELSDAIGFGVIRQVLQSRGFNLEPKAEDIFSHMVAEIEQKYEGDDLVIGFSGGIDSNIVAEAVLASTVPRDKIHIVHFDFGVNRTENSVPESEAVLDRFEARTGVRPDFVQTNPARLLHEPITLIDEHGEPQGTYTLSEQTDSELKRKIFAQFYADAFTEYFYSKGLDPDHTKLVQGTLYPDVIESLGKGKVKTHHNQSPVMVYMEKNGKTINPANRYFKNDMRQGGQIRGFEEIDWNRDPFPGPGFIPRIVCSDGIPILPAEARTIWEQAREIVSDEFGLILGGFKTVGQKGDRRSYAWPFLVTGEADWEYMARMAQLLSNKFPQHINRLYHLTGDRVDGISTPEDMTRTHINEETLNQLRPIDDKATDLLRYLGANEITDQVPIGLLPSPFMSSDGERTAFLRPFRTPRRNAFLSGEAVLPTDDPALALWYEQAVNIALSESGIKRVAYDVTSKPPGSTEAE